MPHRIPFHSIPDQSVIVPEQPVANEADDTPRDGHWTWWTTPRDGHGMHSGHGGQADGGLRYNVEACPSAFNLKIGYLPIPSKVVTVTLADQERTCWNKF